MSQSPLQTHRCPNRLVFQVTGTKQKEWFCNILSFSNDWSQNRLKTSIWPIWLQKQSPLLPDCQGRESRPKNMNTRVHAMLQNPFSETIEVCVRAFGCDKVFIEGASSEAEMGQPCILNIILGMKESWSVRRFLLIFARGNLSLRRRLSNTRAFTSTEGFF